MRRSAALARVACAWLGAPMISLAAHATSMVAGSVRIEVRAEAPQGAEMKRVSGSGRQEYGYPEGDNQFELVDYRRLEDVVVWLESADAAAMRVAPREGPVMIDIGWRRPDAPAPVVVACVGQVVEFRNRADKPCTVYSLEPAHRFECKDVLRGERKSHTFDQPGVIEIMQAGREEIAATLVIAPAPFVTKTRVGEKIEFKGVIPGEWTVRAWHSRLPGASAPVVVKNGERAEATVTLTVNALPEAP